MDELYQMEKAKVEQVFITLNSLGGEVHESLAVYDVLKAVKVPTTMLALGMVASGAVILLQAGDVRLATPNASFMLHELWAMGNVPRGVSQMEDEAKRMKKLQDRLLDILCERTGKGKKEFLLAIKKQENWMTAQEALEWNLIDKVVETW